MRISQCLGECGLRGIAFLLLFVGALFQRWNLDFDTWFILNSGRYVMEHGIPHLEPFTIHEGLHFVLEQWLTSVLFWKIYENFGPMGLLHLSFLIVCLLLYAYYRLCLLVSNENRQVSTLMTVFVGVMGAPFFFVTRPQIISTLFFVVEVFLLEKYARTNCRKWLFPLPIMSLLLVSLHAALWPMLFVLLVPFFIVVLANRIEGFPKDYLGSRFDGRPLFLTAVVMFLTGFCNPYGWEAMAFVFYSYDPSIHGRIGEIHPATVQGIFGKFFFGWLLLLAITQARKAMPLQYILLALGTAILGLLAQRNAFLFFFLGTFPLAYAARIWQSSLLSGSHGMGSPLRLLPFLFLCVLAGERVLRECSIEELPSGPIAFFILLFLAFLCYFLGYTEKEKRFSFQIPLLRLKYSLSLFFLLLFGGFTSYYFMAHDKDFGARYEPTIDYLLAENEPSDIVLWTSFNTGAYPEFRGIRCYVDARPEVFLPSNSHQEHNIIQEYFDLAEGNIYYKDFFRQYNFTHILTVKDDGIPYVMLPHDDDFRLVYEQKDEKGEVVCRLFEPVAASE